MHFLPHDSFLFAKQMELDSAEARLLDPKGSHSPEIDWGFRSFKVLAPILQRMFPNISAYYVIVRDAEGGPNASVRSVKEDIYVISVNTAAIEQFVDCGNHFASSYSEILDSEIELALAKSWTERPDSEPLPNIAASLYAACALVAILGHELGHVHEGQFKELAPMELPVLVNHGTEFAADGWAVWAAAALADPFVEIARSVAYEDRQAIACDYLQSTLVLSAFSCIDKLSFEKSWTPSNLFDATDTHPVDLVRFKAAAVSLIDWWVEQKERDLNSVTTMVVQVVIRILRRVLPPEDAGNRTIVADLLLEQYDKAAAYISASRTHYGKWVRPDSDT